MNRIKKNYKDESIITIKRYILFNIFFSTLIISFFCFKLNLRLKTIIIHLCFIGYYLIFIFSFLIIIKSFFKTKLIPLIILIFYEYYICVIYLSFYLGIEELGLPFTFEVIYPYFSKVDMLIQSGYVSLLRLMFFLILIVLITLLQVVLLKKISIEISFLNSFFLKKHKRSKIVGILIILLFPISIKNIEPISLRIYHYKNSEPLLTFFYATMSFEDRSSGLENIKIKDEYPSNLSFEKKNVILIICDALRADYIGVYGNEKKVTPFLDSLVDSKKYTKFDNYYSTTSWSYNGISNILSSSYKLFNNNFFIHDVLKKQDYDVQFILSGDMENFWKLGNHIRTNSVDNFYDGHLASIKKPKINLNDDKEIVLDKLKEIKPYNGNPTFFYLHYMSTHQVGVIDSSLKKYHPENIDLTNSTHDKLILKNNYNNRVSQLDHYLNKTFKLFKTKNYLDNSIIIITADHGQSLGEKEKYFHGKSTYLSEIKIPLIISQKKDLKKVNIKKVINQLDIAPTITDLLKIPKPKNWKGKSVFDKTKKEPIFQHQRYYYSVIWEDNEEVYQFVYNKKTKKEEVFNIDNNKENIINDYSSIKLDSIKKILFNFYTISP